MVRKVIQGCANPNPENRKLPTNYLSKIEKTFSREKGQSSKRSKRGREEDSRVYTDVLHKPIGERINQILPRINSFSSRQTPFIRQTEFEKLFWKEGKNEMSPVKDPFVLDDNDEMVWPDLVNFVTRFFTNSARSGDKNFNTILVTVKRLKRFRGPTTRTFRPKKRNQKSELSHGSLKISFK